MTKCFAILAVVVGLATNGTWAAEAPMPAIHDCTSAFKFGFLAWEKAPTAFAVEPNGLHIVAKNAQGGAGLIAGGSISLAGRGDWTPTLRVAVGPDNNARALTLHLGDADGTGHQYRFDLSSLKPGEPAVLLAEHGASLVEPTKVEKPGTIPGLDLSAITNVMIIGDWTDKPVNLYLSGISVAPPDDSIRAARDKFAKQKAQEAEQARQQAEAKAKARQELLEKGAAHPADGPSVEHICAVAPDILTVTIQSGTNAPNQLIPYVPQPDDEIVREKSDEPHYIVKAGKVIEDHDKALYRKVNGQRTRIGTLSPDGKHIFKEGQTVGTLLDPSVVDVPQAYAIQSADDPAYASPAHPRAVHRKSKPNGNSRPLPFVHNISLVLPSPLKGGASYTVRFIGLNTARESVVYRHDSRAVRSDAVHAIQTGYRPRDPFKRAYLSIWLGPCAETGRPGGYTHQIDTFELIDTATGKTVFTGKPHLTKALDARERLSIHDEKDYTQTAVHRLDFSSFDTPGEYRVHVPGIGTSYPFRIAADVWEEPFRAAMLGILTQRQGIELGPPVTEFRRGRAFHPDDGVEFYQLTICHQEGQEAGEGGHKGRGGDLAELAAAGKLQRVSGIWGGYQDAGDWDTLGHHLNLTWLLLELYELAPAYFGKLSLSLPPEEKANALPDLIDEAMWQMACFRRLQLPDGGVRGGYGEGWGCRKGQTSSMVRSAGVYAPDPVTTYSYAACAARAYRVLSAFDKPAAAQWLESGRRAYVWARNHDSPQDALYKRLLAANDWGFKESMGQSRTLAAVELYAATGEQTYHADFKAASELVLKQGPIRYLDQADADFAYARLPDNLADKVLKARAIEVITAYADYAIAFSANNAFEIINGNRTDLPVIGPCTYFSAPGVRGYNLVRAYSLTRQPRHLAAVVQACNYSLGANPDNLSYCPGIGHKPVRYPFKVDSIVTGQFPQPVGFIPFGQGDEASPMSRGANSWVRQWYTNYPPNPQQMTPDYYEWPANEVYIDFGIAPMMNENTLNATTLAAAYFWGFLAAQSDTAP